MITNRKIEIYYGINNFNIYYSFGNHTTFADLLEYVSQLYPNLEICPLCNAFSSNNFSKTYPNDNLIRNYDHYYSFNLYIIKIKENCEHKMYLNYSKNTLLKELDNIKRENNNLKNEKRKQNDVINKLNSEIERMKKKIKEQNDIIGNLKREKLGLELAINGDIEKIKLLEELNIKGAHLKEKDNMIKIDEKSKLIIPNQVGQKIEFKNFYDVIIHINSIKDINKGWRIEFGEKGKNNYDKFKTKKVIKIGVIGNANKGKSFLLSRMSKIYLPSGTSL